MPFSIKMIIVDDSKTFVEGLRAVLEGEGGFEIAATADNKEEGLRLARKHQPNIALVDLRIKGSSDPASVSAYHNGIDLIEFLRVHVPDTSIVSITFSRDEQWLRESVRAGASGYISKDWDIEEIIRVLRMAATGMVALTRKQLRLIAANGEYAPWTLTSREMEVLRYLEQGLGNREISEVMGLAHGTIRKHVEVIREKLGAKTRGEAVAIARRRRII
ncbi:MAG: response regulator transcription factor [Chloroflexi bacterium]|nr:response regulator transcription factor [Chloroflexota bacterium]